MKQYLLPCGCGQPVVVAPHQAGQTVTCGCGATLTVPSLLQMKKLTPANGVDGASGADDAEQVTIPASRIVAKRWLLRSFGGLALVASAAFFVVTYLSYPQPEMVLNKRVEFRFGDIWVRQDGTPLPVMEQWVLVLRPEHIDMMSPIEAYFYFDALSDGPAMSFNFRENYQTLIDGYHIRLVACGVLMLLALGIFLASWLIPSRETTVGVRRGTSW